MELDVAGLENVGGIGINWTIKDVIRLFNIVI